MEGVLGGIVNVADIARWALGVVMSGLKELKERELVMLLRLGG